MKKNMMILFLTIYSFTSAQYTVTGKIQDENSGKPIPGISVVEVKGESETVTDEKGVFSLQVNSSEALLQISGKSYDPYSFKTTLPLKKTLLIKLARKTEDIEEITLSTGYQKIPKERATGSFTAVTRGQLQNQVTSNIMDRLAAIANGVVVDNSTSGEPRLSIRGISTINGPRDPLIILDDFPYEGSVGNLDPDMVENITILKDAAAASIWGARAANGVIVITSKKGKIQQPIAIEINSSTTVSGKPNLNYIKQMTASDFIDVEKKLFGEGFYNDDIQSPYHPVLTPVVDILHKKELGVISEDDANQMINQLRNKDMRDQYSRYMYRPMENRQYTINLSGGTSNTTWHGGLGYDDNSGNLGETYKRLNLKLMNTWKINNKLSFTAGGMFVQTKNKSGRSAYGSITYNANWMVPYLTIADDNGNPIAMPHIYDQEYLNDLQGNGLLDWNYYPLTNWRHTPNTSGNVEMTINTGVQYKISKDIEVDLKYQYQNSTERSEQLYDENSYDARDYVNQYAQFDDEGNVSFIVPKGGILDTYQLGNEIHNIRGQISFKRTWNKHSVNAIAGVETRETSISSESDRIYGYYARTKTVGNVDLSNQYPTLITGEYDYIISGKSLRSKNIRFASLYSNAAYTFDKKYTLSASIRRDASNLFGLDTNDKWNPFWSVGAAWNPLNESFFDSSWISDLKLRTSYGFNGNIDPSMVAVTTIKYNPSVSVYTGTPIARIDQYYNPKLRWETSRIMNFGIDFSIFDNRLSGSVEWYAKKGTNLFGVAPLDYTTGISSMLMNVAAMKGTGMDIQLKIENLKSKTFSWNSLINFSTYKDEITDYYLQNKFASDFVSTTGSVVPISGTVGMPVYGIFAYRSAGLDPENGDPRGFLNGHISKDYTQITGAENGTEDLRFFGSAIPTYFGSLHNSFIYRNISVEVGITYKFGYWFRRNSISYTDLIYSKRGHSDYALRWQKPGDEQNTSIPSEVLFSDPARDKFFQGSEALVEKGDHIRLKYITFNYDLTNSFLQNISVKKTSLYASVNNIGIIWKANKVGIDPDYSFIDESLKPVTTFSFGIRVTF